MITKLDLERAWARTRPYVKRTAMKRSSYLSDLWEAEVFLKHEQQQEIGAFKIRGAANFCGHLPEDSSAKVLVTHSSGNHAQAVAFMANKMNWKAHIVMPENSNKVKVKNAERWGATIHYCDPTFKARLKRSEEIQGENNGILIPPFDHEWIVEGQATAAMEMIAEQQMDVIVTPLGGGGLLAGTALAAKHFSSNTEVIGSEPKNASDGFEGFSSGKRVLEHTPNTIADGLRTLVGEVPFDIIKEEVSDIWLADEEHIVPWMYRVWKEEKVVIEPSCAVPFTAIHQQKERLKGKRIGIIITGGNVDLSELPFYSDAGL